MVIEVATPDGSTTTEKGDLLESFAERFVRTQGFEVETKVRVTAAELDLLCKHKVNGRTVYVECKAHRDNIGADVFRNLLGTVTFNHYDEGWLVSTGPLGKDAKGFKDEWERRDVTERRVLSIYTPQRVVENFVQANVIGPQPTKDQSEEAENLNVGDWLLLITQFGAFWAAPTLESGVPAGVIVYDAESGKLVQDLALLRRIAGTDCSLRSLDFERAIRSSPSSTLEAPPATPADKIVEVAYGDSWTDYRPARPQDFVGRLTQQEKILSLLNAVRVGATSTRVFAVTGDSGMGKSSLIAKMRDRTRNKRNKRKFFTYALDARSARSSRYVLASLVEGLRSAAECGFGDARTGEIVVSDFGDPLSSTSIQEYLSSLAERRQVICLIFDQFEELYSKPELFEVFEEAQRLFMSTISACANLVLGFAWRTDSTVPQDHPAYYMWHRLGDHRLEIGLGPFSDAEAAHALTLFEKELKRNLHPELRRQILENSRGYPWLLKKLCIHLFDQLEAGVEQSDLRETLDARTLFERDIQQLSGAQRTCLNFIAQTAPADWFEVLDTYGPEAIRGLQDRRLIVKSGDRVNIYWDIFRDYLLTGKTPPIPFTYIPSSPSLGALLLVAGQLRHGHGVPLATLAVAASLSEKTVGNIVRDLRMFGIATGEHSAPTLDSSLSSGELKPVLEKIRIVLRRHAVTSKLNKLEHGTAVSLDEIADELQKQNRGVVRRQETWRFYAERLGAWLTACGLLVADSSGGWLREDAGTVMLSTQIRRLRTRDLFTGEAPPGKVVEALEWLSLAPRTYGEISAAGFRNATSVLTRYGIVSRGKDKLFRVVREIRSDGAKGTVWRAILEDDCIADVVRMVESGPSITGIEIGARIAETYSQKWSRASKTRNGNALRRWADWVLSADGSGAVPSPPEGRAKRSSADAVGRGLILFQEADEIQS